VPSRRYGIENVPSKLELGVRAIENALADAGLEPSDVDCLLSYGADSSDSVHVASAMGLSLANYVDIVGGGSSSETLIAMATGMIEARSCHTAVIYRSLHGYSGERVGLGPAWTLSMGSGVMHAYGVISAAQQFSPVFASYLSRTAPRLSRSPMSRRCRAFMPPPIPGRSTQSRYPLPTCSIPG
jgi:hypothetical protein